MFWRKKEKGANSEVKMFFASDLHGSNVCFRKFVNSAKFYGVDVLVLGGDLTGKAVIPIAGALIMLQGVAEIIRCIVCLKTGEWPSRLKDVAEIDVIEEQLAHSEYVDEESRKLAIEGAQRIDEMARQRGMGGDLNT